MNSVFKNLAGTISNVFRIGIKGPSISWSQTSPTGGSTGDLCVVVGATPTLLQKRGSAWEDVSSKPFVLAAVTQPSYICDGTEDLVVVTTSGAVTVTLGNGTVGKSVIIKEGIGQSRTITIDTSAGQTIDGVANTVISSARGFVRLTYGIEWHIV